MSYFDLYGLTLHFDFNPSRPKGRPPLPSGGSTYYAPDVSPDVMPIFLYNFFITRVLVYGANPNDIVILQSNFLSRVRAQSQFIEYRNDVIGTLEQNASAMFNMLWLGMDATFENHNKSGIVADFGDAAVRLTLQQFTVYWVADCNIGPKICKEGKKYADFTCKIKWELYDKYDFKWYDFPYGYIGTSFHIIGDWEDVVNGWVREK